MKANLKDLMAQANEMQEKMAKAQEELQKKEYSGEAGAGLVKVIINGRHDCKKVSIDPAVLSEDPEMLEDLIAAAVNDANRKVEEGSKAGMSDMFAGMNMPAGFKMPF